MAQIYYSSGAQKSNTGLTRLKSRCLQGFIPFWKLWEWCICLLQLLETFHTCLCPAFSISLPILPSSCPLSLKSSCKGSCNQVVSIYILRDNFPISGSLRLIIFSKSLCLYHVIYSEILEIRTKTSLRGYCSACHMSYRYRNIIWL